jgi:hypothetical protein
MTTRPKCQCRDGCRFTADEGEPYKLAHDPRPERQEARSLAASALSAKGAVKRAENRSAAIRHKCSLGSIPALIAELEGALLLATNSGADKIQRANAITKIVMAAHDILARDTAANADKLAKLLADNPTLARRLELIK